MNKTKLVLALGLAGFTAICSQAAIATDEGWYLGGGVGQSRAKIHDDRIKAELAPETVTSIDDTDSDIGFKLFGGRKFNRHFAVEGGYFNLGKFGFTANTDGPGSLTGNIRLQGLNVDAVGILPFSEKFSALGRVGLTYTQARDQFSSTGTIVVTDPNPSKNEANYKVGLGLQYDITRSLGLRGEWERYRINDAVGNKGDVDMLLVGLVYTFGATKPAAQAAKPAPAPAPAPAPVAKAVAPVLIIVPVAAKTQEYCSILDIQFEINQKTVQHEYQGKVDKVATFMKKYPGTTALIEGHSDEVGTAVDNQKLSEQRASGVVTNLVDRGGIARNRLSSVGYGETRPIGDNKTEDGRRLNRRINAVIACATDIEGIAPVADRITMAMELEFDTNSSAVRPQYQEELRKVVNILKANPRATASVEGHTSNRQGGTPESNMVLSQQRAQSVVNAMADQGIDRKRLFPEGFGETRRYAYNTSIEGKQDNRRVNIIIDFPK